MSVSGCVKTGFTGCLFRGTWFLVWGTKSSAEEEVVVVSLVRMAWRCGREDSRSKEADDGEDEGEAAEEVALCGGISCGVAWNWDPVEP